MFQKKKKKKALEIELGNGILLHSKVNAEIIVIKKRLSAFQQEHMEIRICDCTMWSSHCGTIFSLRNLFQQRLCNYSYEFGPQNKGTI